MAIELLRCSGMIGTFVLRSSINGAVISPQAGGYSGSNIPCTAANNQKAAAPPGPAKSRCPSNWHPRHRKHRSQPTVTRRLLVAVGVYSVLLVVILNLIVLNFCKLHEKAIFMMADGLILLWIIVGGSLTLFLQKRLVPRLVAIPIDWRLRFVILSTIMALIEEVITTSMTNLAPVFGSTPEEAHITASTNYFTVVCFHSVVVIAPMFVAWDWMLSHWNFSPLKVLLLFGLTGSLAEGGINWTSLIGGFWVFVYGLMVYLPACTVPVDRGARPLRWWHYPMAVFLPFLAVIPVVPVVLLVRRWLGVQFFPGIS